jgi:DNA replication protein DnaC
VTDPNAKRDAFRAAAQAEREGLPLPPAPPDAAPPPAPATPAAEVFQPEFQDAQCACGATFRQTKLAKRWLPEQCRQCQESADLTRTAVARAHDTEARDHAAAKRADRALAALEVRPKYRDVTLGTFRHHGTPEDRQHQARVLQIARRYLGSWPDVEPILVFRGGPGTGKGHVAWSIAKELAEVHAARVEVVKLSDLVRRLRSGWGRAEGGEAEDRVLAHYRGLDLLILDEVSSHAFYGQNIHQHLYDVLDDRAEFQRPTILTSNESDAGLEAILRPALWDRLFDGGGILDFGSASWRSRPMEAA